MSARRPRVASAELALVAVLAAWGFFPVVLLLRHAAAVDAQFTGADGLIGAHGVLGADQLQYLSWARDAAGHGLASDLFTLGPSGHVYLEPVFEAIAGLWRLGVSLPVGTWLLKGAAAIVLAAGASAWARRFFAAGSGAWLAAVVLSLFLFTPAAAVVSWAQLGSASLRFGMYLIADELLGATKLWGYLPAAFALGLTPVALLALERALADPRTRRRRAPLAGAAGAAGLASWLHPWQGITLVLILAGLAIVRRPRRRAAVLGLAAVALAAALPLAYYAVLAHTDPAWRAAAHAEHVARLSPAVLALGLGPLAPLAALGVRRPRQALAEQALLLWIPAAALTYALNDAFASHGLQGLGFPFAVLAVRGAQRVRLPRVAGALAVVALTVPGLAYDARKFARTAATTHVQYDLPHADAAALAWVAGHAPPGGVLAPTPFATVVPEASGRAVWAGHGFWTPDDAARSALADRLFDGRLSPAAARALVRRSGARILLADCDHPADLVPALRPRLAAVRRFGCARVYVLTAPGR